MPFAIFPFESLGIMSVDGLTGLHIFSCSLTHLAWDLYVGIDYSLLGDLISVGGGSITRIFHAHNMSPSICHPQKYIFFSMQLYYFPENWIDFFPQRMHIQCYRSSVFNSCFVTGLTVVLFRSCCTISNVWQCALSIAAKSWYPLSIYW